MGHELRGFGSNVTSISETSDTTRILVARGASSGSTTGAFGTFILDVLDYSNTLKNTTTRALFGAVLGNDQVIGLSSGLFISTNAITSLTLSPQNDGQSFVTGSRFSLYGIRG
jgi:hypothetical protein